MSNKKRGRLEEAKTIDVKEIKFNLIQIYMTTKSNGSVTKFLDHGDKVKITMRFRGRKWLTRTWKRSFRKGS